MEKRTEQEIKLINREKLSLTCVRSVLAFEDDYLKIDTETGVIIAEGKDLLIENLSKDRGEIYVVGKINKIEFYEPKKKR